MIEWWLLGSLVLALLALRRGTRRGCASAVVFVVVYTAFVFVALPAALLFVLAVVLATAVLGGLRS